MNDLMNGKRGLVMGVANDHSIAWGMASALHKAGAELAFTYQGDAFGKRVKPLAASVGSEIVIDCDASNEDDLDNVFNILEEKWGKIDFIIHAIAFSNKDELQGRYVDTSLDNFLMTMHISCFSFTSVMRRAKELMTDGGSAVTLTYYGSQKVMPNYNVMGVAKAALEASVRYLAADLGPSEDGKSGIRVNAISAGPMRTLAGAVIGGARKTYKYSKLTAPLRRPVELDELGGTALYLLSDLSTAVTGETHYVDCGYNAVGMIPHDKIEEMAG
ncbi:MAG: enoyl-[acyl-carrier-protein] reductase FabI [Alphaproteobacteria bacterium]|nr:MAG: enoyl-[acyl-carrier-protein] reductase FabI [Alphaproteobacteria bacterium]